MPPTHSIRMRYNPVWLFLMDTPLDLIINKCLRREHQLWGERMSQTRPGKKRQNSFWQSWCLSCKTHSSLGFPGFPASSATISVYYTDSYSSSKSINVKMTQNSVFGPYLLSTHTQSRLFPDFKITNLWIYGDGRRLDFWW